jgi:site-specific DNA-cytosine methylase
MGVFELKPLKVISLCDGIASGFEALKRLVVTCDYHAIEIDVKKRTIADQNHKEIIRPTNNVYDALESIVNFNYDLVLCGFTCTSLTSQGSRKLWGGESAIFFECLEILKEIKKVNPNVKFLFENVHSMPNTIREEISKLLGVEHFLGDSSLTSPQGRKRYYWFNWDNPEIKDKGLMADNFLDDDGLCLIACSKSNRNKKGEKAIVEGRIRKDGKSGALLTGIGCRGVSTLNMVLTKKLITRPMTIEECKRFQSIPNYVFNCDDKTAFNAIGNGWEVGIITEILKEMPEIKATI